MSSALKSTSRARPRPMSRGNRAMGPPPGTTPTPTSKCEKSEFSRLAKPISQASRSSLPFPVARPRIRAIETNGARVRRTRTSGHASRPVGPCGMLVRSSKFARKSEWFRKTPSTALSKTTTFSRSSFSSSVTISRICQTNSGPMRLSGGLSSTTRQYEGVTRSSLTCAVFVVEFIRNLRRVDGNESLRSDADSVRLSLFTEEREQCRVDFVGMRPGDVVRPALDRDERAIGNQRRKPRGGRLERKDAVLRAVHDEYRDVDLREISPEVGQPGIDTGIAREWRGAGRDVEAGLPGAVADSSAAEDVDVEKVVEEVLEERVAIIGDGGLDVVEDLGVDA